jgi:ABC-type amino acid transport substrate-binding protein
MLVEGKVDIVLSGIIEDSAEYKNLIYTKPYYLDEQVVLVNKGKNINNINDLKSMHIGSIKGSNSMSNFLKIQPDVFSISFSEYPQLIKALTNNNIDAITAGSSWAKEQVKLFDNKFKILNIIVCNNKYSIALKKGNDSLRDKLNSLFVSITTDNTYEKIYKKWFK